MPKQRGRFLELRSRKRDAQEEREYSLLNSSTDFADRRRAMGLAAESHDDRYQANHDCNRALNSEVATWDERELAGRCASLRMPMLILHGEGDPRPARAPPRGPKRSSGCAGSSAVGVGYIPWPERPELLEAALRSFLEEQLRNCHSERSEESRGRRSFS